MKQLLSLIALCLINQVFAQSNELSSIQKYREANTANDTIGLRKNTDFIQEMMQQRGIQNIQLLQANTPNTAPVVYGEVKTPGATKTLIFYAHYDGQPVNPAQWAKGLKPYNLQNFKIATIRQD